MVSLPPRQAPPSWFLVEFYPNVIQSDLEKEQKNTLSDNSPRYLCLFCLCLLAMSNEAFVAFNAAGEVEIQS
jgi:hypothetical protein